MDNAPTTTGVTEWTEDTQIGRSKRSERHDIIRPSRRSVIFGGVALTASVTAAGAGLLATVMPAGANPFLYRITGFDTSAGSCGPNGWVNRGSASQQQRRSCIGCGPSVVYSDACNTAGQWAGYHRGVNDESWILEDGAWWQLRPGQCPGGWDGWKWRADSSCAGCPNMYWRCHDGYIGTQYGTNKSICRWCVSDAGNE